MNIIILKLKYVQNKDNWAMAYSILAVQMTVKALGVLFCGGAWYFSKRSHIRDDVATE